GSSLGGDPAYAPRTRLLSGSSESASVQSCNVRRSHRPWSAVRILPLHISAAINITAIIRRTHGRWGELETPFLTETSNFPAPAPDLVLSFGSSEKSRAANRLASAQVESIA